MTAPELTGAHPFARCICATCGPPWRTESDPKPHPDSFDGVMWRATWMALCPRCGWKRCPGAIDHARPCGERDAP